MKISEMFTKISVVCACLNRYFPVMYCLIMEVKKALQNESPESPKGKITLAEIENIVRKLIPVTQEVLKEELA